MWCVSVGKVYETTLVHPVDIQQLETRLTHSTAKQKKMMKKSLT
jgi:hypothetical protein